MRKWRVGTFSMGILLIILGITLFISLIKDFSAINYLISAWPIILIILGAEILLYIYFSKDDQPKVKYDFLSMLFVIIIGTIAIGSYSLTTIGILPRVQEMISSKYFLISIPEQSISLEENIEKIIVNMPNNRIFTDVRIKKTNESEVVIIGNANVFEKSFDTASGFLNSENIKHHQIGNTILVEFDELVKKEEFSTGISQLEYMIFLPEHVDLEFISVNYVNLTIDGAAINDNFIINTEGKVTINFFEDSNVTLEAIVPSAHYLSGNINWDIETNNTDDSNHDSSTLGKFQLSSGSNNLKIISKSTVEVNKFTN